MVEKQYGCTVKIIRTDGGTHEYCNKEIRQFCEESGLIHQLSNAYCQSENGAAERHNSIDAAYIRTLLASVGFPAYMWPEAQRHGVYLDNRTPKRRLGWVTPYECLTQKKPEVTNLPVFGSLLTAFIPAEIRSQKTLGARAVKGRFLGVENQYKAFRIWDIDNSIITHSRSVRINKQYLQDILQRNFDANPHLNFKEVFYKNQPKGCPRGSQLLTNESLSESVPSSVVTSAPIVRTVADTQTAGAQSAGVQEEHTKSAGELDKEINDLFEPPQGMLLLLETVDKYPSVADIPSPVELATQSSGIQKPSVTSDTVRTDHPNRRRPARVTRMPKRYSDYLQFINHLDEVNQEEKLQVKLPEPRTLKEALSSEYAEEWRKAVATEYQALIGNQTWELVTLPPGRKAIKSKWIFTVKYLADGNIDKFKSRLCVVGCMQKSGLDFDEVFSPVCRLESLRVFLALSAALDLHLHQLDITTAFLHADIDEEVYMEQPAGTAQPGTEQSVCLLKKALYGLRQSPRLFYKLLHGYLISIGFRRTSKDHCIYVKEAGVSQIILAVYVDDLSLGCSCLQTLNQIKEDLRKRFKITDGGELTYILKMQVSRDRNNKKLYLSQSKYIQDTVRQFGLQQAKSVSFPQVPGKALADGKLLTKEEEANMGIPYRSLIGSLVHIQRGTRPDISNAVRDLSRFLNCYTVQHYKAASRVLCYLKHTSDYGLVFDGDQIKNEVQIFRVYSDASFGNPELCRQSVTGFAILLAGAAVCYKSISQKCVSISTFQAEMIACSEACREAEWLRMLLGEIGFLVNKAIPVYCDNTAVVQSVKNPVNHKGSKHFEIRHLYARELQETGRIAIEYVNTSEMIGDIMTKALPEKQFIYLRNKLGIQQIPKLKEII